MCIRDSKRSMLLIKPLSASWSTRAASPSARGRWLMGICRRPFQAGCPLWSGAVLTGLRQLCLLYTSKGELPSVRMELSDITAYLRRKIEPPKDRMPRMPVKIKRKEKTL